MRKLNWSFIALLILVALALIIILSTLQGCGKSLDVEAAYPTEDRGMPSYVTKFTDGQVTCYVVVSSYGRDISCVK